MQWYDFRVMDLLALLWNQMMLHSIRNESQCQTSISYQQHLTKTTDPYLWKMWTAVITGGINHKLYWLAFFLHVHLFVHIHRFNWKLKQYISFFDERWGWWIIVHIGIMIYPSQQQRNERKHQYVVFLACVSSRNFNYKSYLYHLPTHPQKYI